MNASGNIQRPARARAAGSSSEDPIEQGHLEMHLNFEMHIELTTV